MKIAFHFKCTGDEPGNYSLPFEKEIVLVLKNDPKINVSTKWFLGDLIFFELASDRIENKDGYTLKPNKDKFVKVVNKWLNPETTIFQKIDQKKLTDAISGTIFCIGAENLDIDAINLVHKQLLSFDKYIGAQEVDETNEIHWRLYSLYMGPRYRQVNDKFFIFWDGINDDSKREDLLEIWSNKGFSSVEYESLNGRYTLFDGYHNFEHARRVAEFKKRTGYLLGYLSKEIFGFGTKGTIVNFPLSPTRLLVMDDMYHEPAGQYYSLMEDNVGPINLLTWKNCINFMIFHRNTYEILSEIVGWADEYEK